MLMMHILLDDMKQVNDLFPMHYLSNDHILLSFLIDILVDSYYPNEPSFIKTIGLAAHL